MPLRNILACLALLAADACARSAEEIIQGARLSAALAHVDEGLNGNLRKGSSKVPVMLHLKQGLVQFQFSENKGPWQVFLMRIEENKCKMEDLTGGKRRPFPPGKLDAAVAGTDLAFEDLSMGFLYWPKPVIEGAEAVGGQPCTKIRINKPAGTPGRYEVVYVWVHEKFGALMRIRGHDRAGALIKEFQVEDVMQVGGNVWTLRKMQVASYDPAKGRRTSITDLTFDVPNRKAGPRGLR